MITDELREYANVLYRLGEIPEWLRDRILEIADRIENRIGVDV